MQKGYIMGRFRGRQPTEGSVETAESCLCGGAIEIHGTHTLRSRSWPEPGYWVGEYRGHCSDCGLLYDHTHERFKEPLLELVTKLEKTRT